MDLFNSKALKKAQAIINDLERENGRLKGDLAMFKHLVRDMDQSIYNMSQQPTWERMRPYFKPLLVGTEHRMKSESDRIQGIISDELYGVLK